eukprot:112783_1
MSISSSHKRKKEIKECMLKLISVSRMGDNIYCADCGQQRPKWVSVTIGCWICMKCSGYHRHLGSTISFVQSTTLDDWKYEQVNKFLKLGGNAMVKEMYGDKQLDPRLNEFEALRFVRQKYVQKAYAKKKRIPNKKKKDKQRKVRQPQQKKPKKVSVIPVQNVEAKDALIPDLMSFDELQNFNFVSDLSSKQVPQTTANVKPNADQNLKRRSSKEQILSKFNNWVQFESEAPIAPALFDHNCNGYVSRPAQNMNHVEQINNLNRKDTGRCSKEAILSKYKGVDVQLNKQFKSEKVQKRSYNEMGGFDALNHIDDLCKNDGFYVYADTGC